MSATETSPRDRPIELLAPAGDWECVAAAIENGADAVYFGLDCGFNARHRAKNFGIPDLPQITQLLRQRNVRGYVTLNTLAFPSELKRLGRVIEQVASAGIDAVLVQDFGVAEMVRRICPELEIHASTQMSLTSAETIRVAAALGLSRVVLARELSVAEIRQIAAATEMPLEVFIHGALCVAYSGQCLTSESLGGRSANRGQCAQACRLPYELICDGEDQELGDVRYLLSPQDLAGYAAIPDLINAGVASIKIEGRLKTPEYVANITHHYRRAIDQAYRSGTVRISDEARREMELSFSRGFSPGWLAGNDHKRLVPGQQSAKRGIELGTIIALDRGQIQVRLDAPVALGDGLAIHDRHGTADQGGRIYSIRDSQQRDCREIGLGQTAWIGFGRGEIDWNHVELGSPVFKNDDPQLNRRLRRTFTNLDPQARQPLDIQALAVAGCPLRVVGRLGSSGLQAEVVAGEPLQVATQHPATVDAMRDKLGRLGGTPFELGGFDAVIEGQPMVPMRTMNALRRDLVQALLTRLNTPPIRHVDHDAVEGLLQPLGDGSWIRQNSDLSRQPNRTPATPATIHETDPSQTTNRPRLSVLCRTLEQVEALSTSDQAIELVYADFHDIRMYRDAVRLAREHGFAIALATVRMQKPGEMGLLRAIGKHLPDWILARNLAAIDYFREAEIPTIADFSLNIANHLSAQWMRFLGVQRVTASYDLNRDQLLDLARSVPTECLEVVIHQQMPMFHMEHCVYCSVLSPGTNKTNCGRPCDHHVVQLRDRVGAEHTLQADIACRNTLFNATPQSGAESVVELKAAGVGWYRIELLDQDIDQTLSMVAIYRDLIDGRRSGEDVWRSLNATNRLGVTRGTLESKRNPLAIL